MQNDETNRQIARTNHRVKILAVKQAILTNTVIRLVASQNDLNADRESQQNYMAVSNTA